MGEGNFFSPNIALEFSGMLTFQFSFKKTSAWQNYENTGFLMRRPGFKASSAKHFLPALDTGHSLSPCASVLSSVKMEIVCGKCL